MNKSHESTRNKLIKEGTNLRGEVSEQLGHAADWARERLSDAKEQVMEVEGKAKHMVVKAEGKAKDLVVQAEEQAQEGLTVVNRWLRKTAKNHPFLLVGSSLGIGLLAGLLLRGGEKLSEAN